VTTTFAAILRRAVDATPEALGGAFAASDGEMVESIARGDPLEWALLTAHYGVILGHLEAALGTWHFGSTEYFVVYNQKLSVVVHTVDAGYFALLAIGPQAPVPIALESIRIAADQLRQEMK
jgi:predicted regulator of Ras-like GTPase activity (Roadblock/LC7/MglB family)